MPPKPSSTSFFTIKPRDHVRCSSVLLYNRLFRAQCVEVQCPEETALDDLSGCRSTNWGAGLEKQTQHFVNLLWCWHFSSHRVEFRRFMQRLPKALWQTGFKKLSRLKYSERLRFMSGRIQVASCPVTLRLSLTGVCKSDCVFQMCCCGTFFEWRRSSLACSRCVGLNL